MATYQLRINYTDGSYDTPNFTIPATLGRYEIEFELTDYQLYRGYVDVGTAPNTYRITGTLTDGSTFDAGTFTTPYYVLTAPSIDVMYNASENTSEVYVSNAYNIVPVKYRIDYIIWDDYGDEDLALSRSGSLAAGTSTTIDSLYKFNNVNTNYVERILRKVEVYFYDETGYQTVWTTKSYDSFTDEEEESTTT